MNAAMHVSFNVAADVSPRKGCRATERVARRVAASMWPRMFRRGRLARLRNCRGEPCRFNVAADVSPRKALESAMLRWIERRPLQCGRGCFAAEGVSVASTSARAQIELQCGRGCFAAEGMQCVLRADDSCSRASMWPRMFRRGRMRIHAVGVRRNHASMWPRLFRRGRTATADVPATSHRLQCGRGCFAAEGRTSARHRNVAAVSFNVAADVSPRKAAAHRAIGRLAQCRLQCGRGCFAAEGAS